MRVRQILFAGLCLVTALMVVSTSGARMRRASAAGQGQPQPSLFGINTGTFESPCPHCYAKDFWRARHWGGRWIHLTGDSIHWDSGHVDYSTMDYGVKLAREHGLGILLSLGGDPKACSARPRPSDYTNCPPTTSHDFRIYKKFLRQELLRYRSDVTYYESWVEPNHANRWPPHPRPAQYATLLKVQYSVFRSVNRSYGLHLKLLFGGPNDFSIAPGSAGQMAALPFTHAVLDHLHGYRAFDGVALHAYRFPPATRPPGYPSYDNVQGIPAASGKAGPYPNCAWVGGLSGSRTWCRMTWPQELTAYEQEFVNHGYGQLPMWLSEFGWPGTGSVPANPVPNASYYPSYAEQRRDMDQAYHDLLRLKFVQAAFWFNLRDYQPGYPNPDPPFFAHYGMLLNTGRPKPAAREFRRLSSAHPRR